MAKTDPPIYCFPINMTTVAVKFCNNLAYLEVFKISGFLLKIRQSTIKYAGMLGCWENRLVDQASDVPSIISFIKSCKIICKNSCNLSLIELQK